MQATCFPDQKSHIHGGRRDGKSGWGDHLRRGRRGWKRHIGRLHLGTVEQMPLGVLVPHSPDLVERRTLWDIWKIAVVWVGAVHGNRILSFAENSGYVILDVHNGILSDDGDIRRCLPSPPNLVDHLRLALSPSPGKFCTDLSESTWRFVRSSLLLSAVFLTVLRTPRLQKFSQLCQTATPAFAINGGLRYSHSQFAANVVPKHSPVWRSPQSAVAKSGAAVVSIDGGDLGRRVSTMPSAKSATDDVLVHLVKQNFYLQHN